MLEIDRGPSASELWSISGYTLAPTSLCPPPQTTPRDTNVLSPLFPEQICAPSYHLHLRPKPLRRGYLVADEPEPLRRCLDHHQEGDDESDPFLSSLGPEDVGSHAGVLVLLFG